MAGKLKDFLFPEKEKNKYDTTTVVVDTTKIKNNDKVSNNIYTPKQPDIFTPSLFSEVEEIANELMSRQSVIVDLTNTDLTIAKRICDFLNGVCYSLGGNVKKIAKLVYLFSPVTNN